MGMKRTIMKVTTISIYVLALIALSLIIFGFIRDNKLKRVGSSEVEAIAYEIYYCIDKGKYVDLYNLSFEGRWSEKKDEAGEAKSYLLDGLMNQNNFIELANIDYGENGWRVNFTSLEITDVSNISRADFASDFPPENEILNYVDKENNIERIYIVNVVGYIVGSCAINDWRKKLPLIWIDQGWKAIVPGTPEDLLPIHREQYLADINFRIANLG